MCITPTGRTEKLPIYWGSAQCMCVWGSLKTRKLEHTTGSDSAPPLNPGQDNAKDGVSHPRRATRLVETAEAERLEMYLRSARYTQPNNYLVSVVGGADDGFRRRYLDSCRLADWPSPRPLLQQQDADGVGHVSSLSSVRQRKTR